MYHMALALYNVLACQNPVNPTQACGRCTSCRWMATNAHPDCMTISPQSFFVSDEADHVQPLTPEQANLLTQKPKTQITVGQVRYLLERLSHATTPGMPRMVIFTNASRINTPAEATTDPANTVMSNCIPPYDWAALPANEQAQWQPTPLKRSVFNAASANRLLKSLEEPGPGTLFVFLAHQQADVMDTLVSRCQTLPFMPEFAPPSLLPQGITQLWQHWLANPHSQMPHQWVRQWQQAANAKTPAEAAALMQQTLPWLYTTLKTDLIQRHQTFKAMQLLHQLYQVEEMLSAHVSIDAALYRLFCYTA
jgi:hypothetical protein